MTAITIRAGYNDCSIILPAKMKHIELNKNSLIMLAVIMTMLLLASVQFVAWKLYHIILWKMIVGVAGSMILGLTLFVICKIGDNMHRQEMVQ